MFVAGEGSTRIHVRSVWFLLLYASDALKHLTGEKLEKLASGEFDNDLLDALAVMLAREMEARARRMLARGYRRREQTLTRVRGRIDHLTTARRSLMQAGRVHCVYSEHTIDLPRYRHILVTLRRAAAIVRTDKARSDCLRTVQLLEREGVTPNDPSASQLSKEQYGHADAADRELVVLSKLVRSMAAPEHAGDLISLPEIERREGRLRDLFEKAVEGFVHVHLAPAGYSFPSKTRRWPTSASDEVKALLPSLRVDALAHRPGHQLIVECKFGRIFSTDSYDTVRLNADYLRQLFSYLTVFAEPDTRIDAVLVAARVDDSPGRDMDFDLVGYPVRVRQIVLTESPSTIRQELWSAITGSSDG